MIEPECVLEFVGPGQCGHTIVAACLDAHPHMMIADELSTMRAAAKGKTREQLFEAMMKDSRDRPTGNLNWRMKIGRIKGQYQGKYKDKLKVLGNKHGWEAIGQYRSKGGKDLTVGYKNLIEVPLKIIHVIRNPFDHLSSWRAGRKGRHSTPNQLINIFVGLCDGTQALFYEKDWGEDFMEVYTEEFCSDTPGNLNRISNFLAVEPYPDWVEACDKRVFDSARRRVEAVKWENKELDRVYKEIVNKYSWYEGYRYEQGPRRCIV